MDGPQGVNEARALLAGARRVVALTGAGISAESGVPTFRGDGGLWKRHRPEDLATPEAFARDPRLVWEWYAGRRSAVAACRPNQGHIALARFALASEAVLVTQNVDGLHERAARDAAGATDQDPSPALPLELHGSLFHDRCSGCGRVSAASATVDPSAVAALPRCGDCGGLLRPAVVWFGEALDAEVLGRAFAAARTADVCLVVGTSALVHPAASLPMATLEGGGTVVEVNPDETPLTRFAAVSIRQRAGDALPVLLGQDARRREWRPPNA